MDDTLKSRLFRTDVKAWNNAWYLYIGTPLLAALGSTIGVLWGVSLASTFLGEVLVLGSCVGVTMYTGFTILAVIDRRGTVDS